MIYMRCKCGSLESWSSGMTEPDCYGCSKCNTTLAINELGHQKPKKHKWITKYDGDTGKPYRICEKCYRKEKEEE